VTLLAYARYCRKPGLLTYLAVLLAYCLGLLSKPMLVTLPCVLLLLDYWPLCRTKVDLSTSGNPECANLPADTAVQYPVSRLIIEKFPLLILSGISVYISFLSLQNISVVVPSSAVPMYLRVANAVVSYTSYIAKMLFPANLAVYYPYPTSMPPFWQIAGACLFLVLVTISSIINSTRRPYFIIGWLWYLGTLVPVAGIVQGGLWPAMADRWAYIPHIGLFIIIAWGTPELFSRGSHKRRWLAAALPIAVLSVLAASTSIHVRYWKNSITLFSHAIEDTDNNPVAHNNLGNALVQRNQIEAAIRHYQKALRLAPHLVETHRSLGNALQKKGQTDEAIVHYREALRVRPGDEKTLNNLGNVFVKKGQYPEAIKHYREVLRIKPDYAKAHNNIALAYLHNGETLKAIKHLKRAIQINPNYAVARFNLEKIEKSPHQSSARIRPFGKGP
jgi:tetratricopeptide (TPR) repeat protein